MTVSTGMDDDIPDAIRDKAIDWALKLEEGDPDETLLKEHQQWLDADPRHARAWARIASLQNSLSSVSARERVRPVLRLVNKRRQRGLNLLALLLLIGSGSAWIADPVLHDRFRYDYVAGVGERKTVEVGEGIELHLNAGSAVDIEGRPAGSQRIRLIRGALQVQTGGEPLTASHGDVTAVPRGTRFGMIAGDERTELHVEAGRIEVRKSGNQTSASLGPGESAYVVDATGQLERGTNARQAMAWTRGMIHARDLPIDAFAKALAPYTRQQITVDPEVRDLAVSGLFPLDAPEVSLNALTDAAPVRIAQVYPWRVRIESTE
ncbi:MAG: DUF4880 domain-containing protein [Spiribacter salinus]|uniref:DUF4880 domain-containing protein n=1 Tax=Spiribacter salinus TaxID=1335746 RepID=A0A540VRF6_9GAMM|nr:MAG: DUF4880 domain-containing protein [Spiribacter salinus]